MTKEIHDAVSDSVSTERALDLALEALEYRALGVTSGGKDLDDRAIKAIKQARALDKKAENARELGLDYEPVQNVSLIDEGKTAAQPAPVQDKVTLIQTNVGIGERAMEAYEAAKERDRAAVAAPVQEPVGVYGHCPVCGAKGITRERRPCGDDRCANGHTYKSIHATTPPAAQRQWVGLTDEEVSILAAALGFDQHVKEVIRKAEAKLKEKNA